MSVYFLISFTLPFHIWKRHSRETPPKLLSLGSPCSVMYFMYCMFNRCSSYLHGCNTLNVKTCCKDTFTCNVSEPFGKASLAFNFSSSQSTDQASSLSPSLWLTATEPVPSTSTDVQLKTSAPHSRVIFLLFLSMLSVPPIFSNNLPVSEVKKNKQNLWINSTLMFKLALILCGRVVVERALVKERMLKRTSVNKSMLRNSNNKKF